MINFRKITGRQGIVADDRAQAMAEFVIVIPVLFLVFMLLMQYYMMVHTAQLGNYAAYVAARVYAVRASIDEEDAMDKAKKAAALAYSPVAGFAPGELPGAPAEGLPELFPAGTPAILDGASDLLAGYATAYYYRLDEGAGGGRLKINKGGSPKQVNVNIDYPFPLSVPGLAEVWRITGGERDINLLPTAMTAGLNKWSPGALLARFPYVNIRSKCAIGYEDWGGRPEYRPRKPMTVDSSPAIDQELEEREAKMEKAKEKFETALKYEGEACDSWKTAKGELANAQAHYNEVMNNPNSSSAARGEAQTTLDDAAEKERDAWAVYESARDNRENKQRKLEDLTGLSMGTFGTCHE